MQLTLMTQICLTLVLSFNVGSDAYVSMAKFSSLESCRRDEYLSSDAISQTTMRSFLDCSQACAANFRCGSFNSCPSADGKKVICQLFDYLASGGCGGLTSKAGCKYREKQNWNPCQHGGTLLASRTTPCECPVDWTGKYCERLHRDCFEANQNSHPKAQNGRLTIQPFDYPRSFDVYCSWGSTYILRRSRESQNYCSGPFTANGDTQYFKKSHGRADGCDYFIGLEHLWAILRQGSYIMKTYLQYHFSNMTNPVSLTARYHGFSIGDESSGFVMNYISYEDMPDVVQNPDGRKGKELFQSDRPRRFCTPNDANCVCAQAKGASWWYGSDCQSEFPLTALPPNDLEIPIDGIVSNLSLATMIFYPNYYHNI